MQYPMNEKELLLRIRLVISAFVIGLVLSGLTAFPLETELRYLNEHSTMFPDSVKEWLKVIYHALHTTNSQFPF